MKYIRNFSIIAHIDHGKSTLADRLLERTSTLDPKKMREQVLDSMDLERERGITIKSHPVRISYRAADGNDYVFNLIDTPGHVDFSYEVSRSLAACEGAILVVDAVQGVEAQTVSNLYMALENDLTIIPVINKIDLGNARISDVSSQLMELLGVSEDEIILVSAKNGTGTDEVLEALVRRLPPPAGSPDAPLRALIFDSVFDSYRGVILYVRITDGVLRPGMNIRLFSGDKVYEAIEVGIFKLSRIPKPELGAGEVGYVIAGIKNLRDAKVGDTIIDVDSPAAEPLPGYKEPKPMVFSGFYPSDPEHYEELRAALERLSLNDSSLLYQPENSAALGFGFRCGFLGMLHMEVIQERLEREYFLDIVATVPNVEYKVVMKDGNTLWLDNPMELPKSEKVERIEEPIFSVQVVTPTEYIGGVMRLGLDKRGKYINTEYLDPTRVILTFEMPLAEIIFDFHDKLKSISKGYASYDYDFKAYEASDLVKLDILINGKPVDAFCALLHRDRAYTQGKEICSKLRKLIPRQLFEVLIQASIGSRVIAREAISPLRKNVTAKCYGGDITRKRKLLERQKAGKKRMKRLGSVEIPQEAFLAVLRTA